MLRPYIKALTTPPFPGELFVKKLTVMGNMGKIQGISTAAKPPNSPAIKIANSDCGAAASVLFITAGFTATVSFLEAVTGCTCCSVDALSVIGVNITSSVDTVSWAKPTDIPVQKSNIVNRAFSQVIRIHI